MRVKRPWRMRSMLYLSHCYPERPLDRLGTKILGKQSNREKTLCVLCICIQHVLPFASSSGIFHVKFIWSLDWNSNVCFQVIKRGHGPMFLKLGPDEIEYDSKFQLYLQSKLPNPHFRPEVRSFENSHKLDISWHLAVTLPQEECHKNQGMNSYEHIWTLTSCYSNLLNLNAWTPFRC